MTISDTSLNRVSGLSSAMMANAWLRQNSSSLDDPQLIQSYLLESWANDLSHDSDNLQASSNRRVHSLVALRSLIAAPGSGTWTKEPPTRHGLAKQTGETLLWAVTPDASRDLFIFMLRTDDATPHQLPTVAMLPKATAVKSVSEAKVSPAVSPLALRIVEEKSAGSVELESQAQADAAVDDALSFVQERDLDGEPKVMLSEDGILTLQWQKDNFGLALLFAGDGVVSISFRRPGQRYAENGVDISVEDDLPQSFNDMLQTILT